MFFVTVLQKQKVYTAMSPFSQFLTEQFQALSEFRRVCILAKCIVSASLFCLSKTLALSSHSSSGCLYRTRTCSQRSSGWRKNFNAGIALVLFNSIPYRMITRNPLWDTFPPSSCIQGLLQVRWMGLPSICLRSPQGISGFVVTVLCG